MLENLRAGQWRISFSAKLESPRGFKYEAEAGSSEEAFLKAVGYLREDSLKALPDVKVLAARVQPPVPKASAPLRKNAVSGLAWVRRRYGAKRYNRLYMRRYRLKQLESLTPDAYGVYRASWERDPIAA